MRIYWCAIGLVGGAIVYGTWMILDRRLVELGVDLSLPRLAVACVSFYSLATIAVDEAADALRGRRTVRRLRAPGIAEVGQISMASGGGELSEPKR
jgi:hypothetical protein